MSTRAIVTVKSTASEPFKGEKYPEEIRRLYCHGDGYPSYLGKRLYNFVNVVKSMGQQGKVWKSGWTSPVDRPGGYVKRSPLGKAYTGMANVLWEPDQFMTALTTYLHSKGYGGTYLTDRDPEKEAREKWTDIEWHYVITLPPYLKQAKPKLAVYELVGEGSGESRKERFVKKSAPVPELVEQELAERERSRKRYEKEQKARERKERRASTGLRGLR